MGTQVAASRRWIALAALLAVAMGITSWVVRPSSTTAAPPGPAGAYWGYSTGTVVHAGLLQGGLRGPRLTNVDEAFSAATVSNKGIGATPPVGPGAVVGQIVNEMSREVQRLLPAGMPGRSSFARGAGLEIGLMEALPAGIPQIPINAVQTLGAAKDNLVKQIGPIAINPVASAAALKGQGTTDWSADTCVLGKPISQGLGHAADVRVLGLGPAPLPTGQALLATAASAPGRAAAQSRSQTALVRQADSHGKVLGDKLAIGTETRQTIAPVTLFKGTPAEVTIEVLGEWVLRAVAGGVPGSAYVRYAPAGSPSPTAPIVRIVRPGLLAPVTRIINFQDLFGAGKLLPIPLLNIPGVASISIGEAPRAIGSDSAAAGPRLAPDGTSAAAAVDIVRVQLFERRDLLGRLLSGVGDVRIGHMEARAEAPRGGIDCPIPVTKTVTPTVGHRGETLHYKVGITNPFDCTLNPVKVVDEIAPGDAKVRVTQASGGRLAGNTLSWTNVGPIAPHASVTLPVDVQVAPDSRAGIINNDVTVNATCTSGGEADGMSKVTVPVGGGAAVDSQVLAIQEAVPTKVLGITETNGTGGIDGIAATGAPAWVRSAGVAMLLAGAFGLMGLRRLRETS